MEQKSCYALHRVPERPCTLRAGVLILWVCRYLGELKAVPACRRDGKACVLKTVFASKSRLFHMTH